MYVCVCVCVCVRACMRVCVCVVPVEAVWSLKGGITSPHSSVGLQSLASSTVMAGACSKQHIELNSCMPDILNYHNVHMY